MDYQQHNPYSQKILIVDDEPAIRLILQEAVEGLAEAFFAASGEEALQLARQHCPDVVLLDISLPAMDGYEVCRRLKEDPRTAGCAVIFVTGHTDDQSEWDALAAGGIDFLVKPVNLQACQLRVRNHLLLRSQARALVMMQQDMGNIVSSLPVNVSCWSSSWNNVFCNDTHGRWFGITARHMLETGISQCLPQSLAQEIAGNAPARGETYQAESSYSLNGREYHIQINLCHRIYEESHQGYLLTLLDITELKTTERNLREEKERIRVTLNSIGDAVLTTDTAGLVTYMNPIAERMTGYSLETARNCSIEAIMPLSDASTGGATINPIRVALEQERTVSMPLNCLLTSVGGEEYRVEDSASPIRDDAGNIVGAVIVFHDVSESVAMAVKMSHLANHDHLTNLPNRMLLHDRLGQALLISGKNQKRAAVLLVDMDHFKYLNETRGHQLGDHIIKLAGERLKSLMEIDFTLARIGGDEFVVVCPKISDLQVIDQLADAINAQLAQPFRFDNETFNLSASVGISIYPDDAFLPEDMMRKADVAMYRAKQEGRNRHCYFSDQLEDHLNRRHAAEKALHDAINNRRLEVHYQPKLDLLSQAIVSVEALVRIRDKSGKLVPPMEFIPLAEETGLIREVGAAVMNRAISDAAGWQREYPGISVAVNVTAAEFLGPGFVPDVERILQQHGLDPSLLDIEVTESALMDNVDNARMVIEKLHTSGISISLDDFGTGYSSLAYLQKFHVDVLKIDQSFVRSMLSDDNSLSIVRTIINLGKSLGLMLCPEGIETREQLDTLVRLGCEVGQGYFFSKPLPAEQLLHFIRQHNLQLTS